MTKKQQNEIKDWFKNDRIFETGKQLFLKYGTSMSFKITLNRGGNTPDNYKFLCYELAKIAAIPEAHYKQMLKTPLLKAVSDQVREDQKEPKIDFNELELEELLEQFTSIDVTELNYWKHKELIDHFKIKPAGRKKEDLLSALLTFQKGKIVSSVPVEVKRGFKLREEFPFLKQKGTPGILKELVADMLTTYDTYVEGHKQLVEAMDEEMIAKLSKDVVENYLENRQIWDELNHYKQNGELLGKHPLFEWITRRDEIRAMNASDLSKHQSNLKSNISKTKKNISDEPEHTQTEKRKKRLEQFEMELAEVDTILGQK